MKRILVLLTLVLLANSASALTLRNYFQTNYNNSGFDYFVFGRDVSILVDPSDQFTRVDYNYRNGFYMTTANQFQLDMRTGDKIGFGAYKYFSRYHGIQTWKPGHYNIEWINDNKVKFTCTYTLKSRPWQQRLPADVPDLTITLLNTIGAPLGALPAIFGITGVTALTFTKKK